MRMIGSVAAATLALGLLAGSALAQQQEGLVNVAVGVEDNVVQVPIGIAAQVCGVDAAVLAEQTNTDDAVCTITEEVAAENNIRGQQGGGGQDQEPQQEGLVNVAVGAEDNVVQVPIGIAAQVCGVDVAALAQQTNTDDAVCTITQEVAAENNIRGQQGGGNTNAQGQGNQQSN